MIRRVVYIISIERYNGKEKVNIELKNESDIHFNLGLNMFFVPINITNFDFSPYKIKLNVFILTKNLFCFWSLMDIILTCF